MRKTFGLFAVMIMVFVVFVPFISGAAPTRFLGAEISGVTVDGFVGPGNELATGDHTISAQVQNTGDEDFLDYVTFYLNITYNNNGTVFENDTVSKLVVIPDGSVSSVIVKTVDFPEGDYNITINATIEGVGSESSAVVMIMDVVDLSIENKAIEEEAMYPMGQTIIPSCNVTYWGNVDNWKDTVMAHLIIDRDEGAWVTYYDEEIFIMDMGSSPKDPGDSFLFNFPNWIPNASGDFRATFRVDHDTYNETNNVEVVYFQIDVPPSVEGWVTSNDTPASPIPDVTVSLEDLGVVAETTTDENGYYSLSNVPDGTYDLVFYKRWIQTETFVNVTIEAPDTLVVNATMTPQNTGGLRGYVYLPNSTEPASQALVMVTIPGYPFYTTNSNESGYYEFEVLPAANMDVSASLEGYNDAFEQNVSLAAQGWTDLDLTLAEIPFEVTFQPPDGEPGFLVDDFIEVEFSRPIDESTVDDSSLILKRAIGGIPVQVLFDFDDDRTVIMTPEADLEYNTEYIIEVTSWIQDINGDYFPGPVYSSFSTEVDQVEIFVSAHFPDADAVEMPVDVTVTATFPVPMDPNTINSSTVKLYGRGSVIIPSTVSYDETTFIVTLVPMTNLDHKTRYSVDLSDNIQAMNPSNVFMGLSWIFTTKELILTGSIEGRVVDEDGNPLPPASVDITVQKGSIMESTNPSTDGMFQFLDLESGIWTLTISTPDHKDYTMEVEVTAGKVNSLEGNIALEPKEEDDEDGDETPWGVIILIIVVVVIFLLILIYIISSRKEEPVMAEEVEGRRPAFRGRPAEGAGFDRPVYEELAEGEFMCPVCGYIVEAEEAMCPNCGSEFEEDLFECPECGASIPADAMECPDCGAMFEEEEETPEEEEEFEEEEEDMDITEEYEVEEGDEDLEVPGPEPLERE